MTVSDLHQINEFSSLSLGNSYTSVLSQLPVYIEGYGLLPSWQFVSNHLHRHLHLWPLNEHRAEEQDSQLWKKKSYMSFTILYLQFLKYITPEELLYTCILCQKRKIYKYYIMPQKTYTMVLYHCVLYQLAGQLTCFETEGSFSFLHHLLDQVAKRKRPPASL